MQIRKRFLKDSNLVINSVLQLNENPNICIHNSIGGIMKTLAIIFFVFVSMALSAWEVGDVITTDYSWTDSNEEFHTLNELIDSGKTIFWFGGEEWSPSSNAAAETLNNWIPQMNSDETYFCGNFNWSTIGYDNLVFSNELNQILEDFTNGYIPLFVIIGNFNVISYLDNDLNEALTILPETFNSFTKMSVLNPIEDQIMVIDDENVFDISDLFIDPQNDPITLSINNNTDPSVVNAAMINDSLYISALSEGLSEISILGESIGESIEYSLKIDVYDLSNNYILIIDLSNEETTDALHSVLEDIYPGGNVLMTNDWNTFPMTTADAVFILLGIYNDNYILTENEAATAIEYLNNGGNLYMEGGDTWAFDTQTTLHTLFNINGTTDGNSDLSNIAGEDIFASMNWSYAGTNSYIDHLEPLGDAITAFRNPDADYNCGIIYDNGDYKTVGTSFEITGLEGNNSLHDALWGIMDFFELVGLPMDPPQNIYVNDWEGSVSWDDPDSTNATGYNVYLDSLQIGFTEELSFNFNNLESGCEYTASISAQYCEGESELISATFIYNGLVADEILIPRAKLIGNYPNPFNPSTTLKFSLNAQDHVSLSIYNICGQLVKKLVDAEFDSGEYAIVWNGEDNSNKRVSSGMYFLRMQTSEYSASRKIMLIK
jgi:Secretion system C-terminal sorting domain